LEALSLARHLVDIGWLHRFHLQNLQHGPGMLTGLRERWSGLPMGDIGLSTLDHWLMPLS
jgi:hypothetical protein